MGGPAGGVERGFDGYSRDSEGVTLCGLGLGEMRFRSSRWVMAFGRLWWALSSLALLVNDAMSTQPFKGKYVWAMSRSFVKRGISLAKSVRSSTKSPGSFVY